MTPVLSGLANDYVNERIIFAKIGDVASTKFLKAYSELSTHDLLHQKSTETFHFP